MTIATRASHALGSTAGTILKTKRVVVAKWRSATPTLTWVKTSKLRFDLLSLHASMVRYGCTNPLISGRVLSASHLAERYWLDILYLTQVSPQNRLELRPHITSDYLDHLKTEFPASFGGGFALLNAYDRGFYWSMHFPGSPGERQPDFIVTDGIYPCLVESKGSFAPAANLEVKARDGFRKQVLPHMSNHYPYGMAIATKLSVNEVPRVCIVYHRRRGRQFPPWAAFPTVSDRTRREAAALRISRLYGSMRREWVDDYARSLAYLLGFRGEDVNALPWFIERLEATGDTEDDVIYFNDAESTRESWDARFGLRRGLHAALRTILSPRWSEFPFGFADADITDPTDSISLPIFDRTIQVSVSDRLVAQFPDGVVLEQRGSGDWRSHFAVVSPFSDGGARTSSDQSTQKQPASMQSDKYPEETLRKELLKVRVTD